MFTGIIQTTGIIKDLTVNKTLAQLTVKAPALAKSAKLGESIAHNGVCLTVTRKTKDCLVYDLLLETLKCTSLGLLKKGDRVNLERALKVSDRLGGHFVTGHVDATTKIKAIKKHDDYVEFQFDIPKGLKKYFVPKGCIALDGISLTVGKVTKTYFNVYLIPHTLKETTWGKKVKGDVVNVETDILSKYLFSDK